MAPPGDTDEELLARTRADPEAFAVFYRRHLAAVLAFVLYRTRDREVAADLCAEVFAAALESIGRYDPALGPARGWLFGIAHNKLHESRRRGRVEDAARRRLGMAPAALTDEDLERVEQLADLEREGGLARALVEGLPQEQREAIVARVLHEREYTEIAGELRCSEAVVRQRVSRGLVRLRAGMGGDR